jgi:dolichol-phosphate mannosyltransferase
LVAAGIGDVFAVDDGSTDGTRDVMAAVKGIHVLGHARRRGVGAALRTGFEHARALGYDILAVASCVGKSRPEDIRRLIDTLATGSWDFVQGSRFMDGGATANMPLHRAVGTRGYSVLFSLLAAARVSDGSSGIRAFRAGLLDDARINLGQPWLDTYELEPYLYFKALTLGYRVTEAPIAILYPADPTVGYTKMRVFRDWWRISRPLLFLRLGIKQ